MQDGRNEVTLLVGLTQLPCGTLNEETVDVVSFFSLGGDLILEEWHDIGLDAHIIEWQVLFSGSGLDDSGDETHRVEEI